MNERTMTDEDVVIQNQYVNADELAELGPRVVTVTDVRVVDFAKDGEAPDEKQVLVFDDDTKLTLNATRRGQLKDIIKPADGKVKVAQLKGLQIKLTTAKVNSPSGKKVNSVQIENGAAF